MSKIICSTVGSLVGDAWMRLPAILDLCAKHEVKIVSGTYALPVWQWGQKYVQGADYEIVHTIDDPDIEQTPMSPFTPGYGYPALNAGLEAVKNLYPGETVYGDREIGSYYHIQDQAHLELKGLEVFDGEWTTIQPQTSHRWKNCGDVVRNVIYSRSLRYIGFSQEISAWDDLAVDFDVMSQAVLQCAGFVGVLSSWGNLAMLFKKRQIVVSFTPDIPCGNPRAVKLVTPTVKELQAAVTEMRL